MKVDLVDMERLIGAALEADYTQLRRIVNHIVHIQRESGELESALRLHALLRKRDVPLKSSGYMKTVPFDSKSRLPLVEEEDWPNDPVFLNEIAHSTFDTFLTDISNSHKLKAKGLASNLRLILSGPPGTGKSLLASHVAAQLNRPFYVARLDSIISSLLGDTAKNIRSLFDFVPKENAVLLLDELDAIAKLRDDRHELGELKRVVNAVIQSLDALDETTVIVAATNHPHLLDPAIWRRFPYKIDMQLPATDVRMSMWKHFLAKENTLSKRICSLLATLSYELSGADIETIALSLRRNAALNNSEIDLGAACFALIHSKENMPVLPRREPLTTDQKRELARTASKKFGVRGSEIAQLLSVSRQAVYGYLRD